MRDVMVVDHGPVMRRILRLALQAAGYRVRLAVNGDEAIRLVGQRAPDAIVADIDATADPADHFVDWLLNDCAVGPTVIFCVTSRTSALCENLVHGRDVLLFEKPFSVRRMLHLLNDRLAGGDNLTEDVHEHATAGGA